MGIFTTIKDRRAFWEKSKKRSIDLLSTNGWGFLGVGGSGVPNVNEESSLRFGAVFACVDRLSSDLAAMPWNTYETIESGGRKIAFDHWAYRMLKTEPNEFQSSFDFRKALFAHAVLSGNGYAVINRDERTLELLLPKDTEPFFIKNSIGKKELWYKDFKNSKVYPAIDIIHIRGLGSDGIKGKSRIQLHRETIGSAMAGNEMKSKMYSSGGLYSGVIEGDKHLKQEALDRLSDSFARNYSGIDNMHKVPVLFDGFKLKQVSMPFKDMQFIEQSQFSIEEICRIFLMPPHKIGHLARSTNNNIEHQGIEYVQYTLLPWVVCTEQEVNRKLFYSTPQIFNKLEMKNLLRGDIKARGEFYKLMADRGALSPNDIRGLEDMNPIDGGDLYMVPLNMIPIDKIKDYDYGSTGGK